MIKFIFEPVDKRNYVPIELKFDLPDDANIYDYFDAWQSFMRAISFTNIDSYQLKEKK